MLYISEKNRFRNDSSKFSWFSRLYPLQCLREQIYQGNTLKKNRGKKMLQNGKVVARENQQTGQKIELQCQYPVLVKIIGRELYSVGGSDGKVWKELDYMRVDRGQQQQFVRGKAGSGSGNNVSIIGNRESIIDKVEHVICKALSREQNGRSTEC